MRTLLKYWKVLLAILLLGASAFFYFNKYQPDKEKY